MSFYRNRSALSKSSTRLTRIFNRFQPSPETVVLLLAVLIGSGTGMGVVTFHYLIELVHHLMLEDLVGAITVWGGWTLACAPIGGGIIVGLMRWRSLDFGPGLSALIAAAHGGSAQYWAPQQLQPVRKMLAASVSLGSGASLGPEGPSVEIGANLGMLLGQVLQVSQDRQRLLLGAGAAAGLAAGFNAPIAGVFFALEVVLGTTFATSAVSVVLLAAVVAALIAQIGLGAQPAFALPVYEVRSLLEFPLYVGLGLGASLVAITYTQAIRLARECFRGQVPGFTWLARISPVIHPVIGGACVGLVALRWPYILGIGYETIEAMLQDGEFTTQLLVILLLLKLVLTAISLGSGFIGGVFAPAMFLGASFGAAYAKILATVAPTLGLYMAAPPAYAMVGMAAVLAASAKAPLTAILLLFELTRDYRIVLPLMAAVGLSVWLVELKAPSATSSSNLPLDLSVEKDQSLEILPQMLVAEAMNDSVLMLPGTMTVLQAGLALTRDRRHSALVIDDTERLIGIVTLEDINRAISVRESQHWVNDVDGNPCARQLSDICTTEILYAYTDELLSEALSRMAARGLHQLPVVDQDKRERVLGLLEREQIDLVYRVAATRQLLRHYLNVPSQPDELSLPEEEKLKQLPEIPSGSSLSGMR
ncbi:MAG: chloride channel protein [Chroococcidiopsidaceae cyanobacterium CP_BM_ER_R8_30]|nr:chloride channel protein [Chroococcidiopsidaceae cyanobacterium CP_BM_ER_R8_30]